MQHAPALPPTSYQESPAHKEIKRAAEEIQHWEESATIQADGVVKLQGNVKVQYDVTTIEADEMELDYNAKRGFARGNVRLIDPEGVLSSSFLEFNWVTKSGSADKVSALSNGIKLEIGRVDIASDKWVFKDLYLTASPRKTPDLAFESPLTTVIPGVRANIRKPSLILFGRKVGPLPPAAVSLDRRVEGFRIPVATYRKGEGLGASWSSGFFLGEQTTISAQFGAFPGRLSTYSATLARSFTADANSNSFITPRSDLRERFDEGFLDNIRHRTPESEDAHFQERKATVAIGTAWNQGTSARVINSRQVSKEWEVVAEAGQSFGQFGTAIQARHQHIRLSNNQSFKTRSVLQATGYFGAYEIAPLLTARARIDGFGSFQQSAPAFTWVRGMASLSYQPVKQIRISGALVKGRNFGTPAFYIDPLYSTNAYHARGDIDLGSIKISGLAKYDLTRRSWYDNEFQFSFVAGSFEPFIQTRLFPREYRIGIQLRMSELFDQLSQRVQRRTEQAQQSADRD